MASFGNNVKMTTANTHRESTRRVFEEIFGCKRVSPNDTIDLFGFADGANIGVDYVEPARALSPDQHKNAGTWLEIAVDDPDATAAALDADPDVEAFTFVTDHRYFQLPGGQVVRLQA